METQPNKRPASFYTRIQFPLKTAPIFLFIAMVLTFGFFIPALGFYWDDWPTIFVRHSLGNFWQYYGFVRPLVPVHDILFTTLLGTSPLAWQISCFIARVAVVISFWWCLKLVWPKPTVQVLAVALIFAVYPVFYQWPLAVTYQSGFIEYALYFISIALMVLAIRKPRWFYIFTIFSLLTAAIQMLISEYYWGLELLRPVLLWIVIAETINSRSERLKRIVVNWLPYLVLLCGVVILRYLAPDISNDTSATGVIMRLVASPIAEIMNLIFLAARDSLYITISTWFQTVSTKSVDFTSPVLLASWGIAAVLFGLTFVYITKIQPGDLYSTDSKSFKWSRQAILVGLFALVVGLLPVWMSGRMVFGLLYADRLALPGMVGASLLIVGIVSELITKWSYWTICFSLLVGLAAGSHIRSANNYRWEWTYQRRFYWQLYWRAPALEPQTSLISDVAIFNWVTKYSLSAALNSLYPVPAGATNLPYWAFELDDFEGNQGLLQGIALTDSVRSLYYSGSSLNSLIISYDPYQKVGPLDHCLWVLSPTDTYADGITQYTKGLLPLSNLSRILPTPSDSNYPDKTIFGSEPEHTWCYYFEKADLARQFTDWVTVANLGNEAISYGYQPNDRYEWMPFIEGYIHVKDWEEARRLSLDISQWNPEFLPAVCTTWTRAIDSMDISTSEEGTVVSIQMDISCDSP
jgi:hypothetical protein